MLIVVMLSGIAGILGYYFAYDFVLSFLGITGLFIVAREVAAHRARRSLANAENAPSVPARKQESEQFRRMGEHELLQSVVSILVAHGYQEVLKKVDNTGSSRVMSRGGRICYVTAWHHSIDEEFIRTLLATEPKRDPSQMVVVTAQNVSPGANRMALDRKINLIDGEELFRLWSLQAKGHRVHALDLSGSRSHE